VIWSGTIRTNRGFAAACHGNSGRSAVSRSSCPRNTSSPRPFTTTLHASPVPGSYPSASKATSRSAAPASLAPSAVRKTTVPWSTTKLTGKISGRSAIETASRPTCWDRSNAQQAFAGRSVAPEPGSSANMGRTLGRQHQASVGPNGPPSVDEGSPNDSSKEHPSGNAGRSEPMQSMPSDDRQGVIEHLRRYAVKRMTAEEARLFLPLAERYYERVAAEDLIARSVPDLFGAALAHLRLAQHRAPDEPQVAVFSP